LPGEGDGQGYGGRRLAGIKWFDFKAPEYFLEGSIYENNFFNALGLRNASK